MNFNVDEVWESLKSHRVQVVQELRVDRTLLFDYLRSKAVFDSEDCELVQAEKTNERKAGKLLDILQTKGTESLVHFLDVVQLLNPGIYEKLTGQKATTRENPIINEVSRKSSTDLDPNRDLDILSNHLKRAVVDLQEMTLRYDQLLKENKELRKRLSKVNGDLDLKSKCLQTTEDQAVKAELEAKEARNNVREIEQAARIKRREYERAMNGRHACLLALLMKLLSSEEEAKQLRKQVEEANRREEELMNKQQRLSKNINKERKISQILSEKLSSQRSSIQSAEDLLDRYSELQFISQKLKMERDQAISELNELKDWAEALKARYDIVEKNSQEYQESYDNAVVDCSQSRKQIQELQFQLSFSQRQESNVRVQNEELTRKVKKYQEQRDFYADERIKAIKERDEAQRERNEMNLQCTDAQKHKDEVLERFLEETREFERRHETLREQLMRSEDELWSLKMDKEFSSNIKPSTPVSGSDDLQTTLSQSQKTSADDENDCKELLCGNGSEAPQGQECKNSLKLVNSIKKRFRPESTESLQLLEIPSEDSMILSAQWLSRLPCDALMTMLCPKSAKSSPGDVSPGAKAFNFEFLSPPVRDNVSRAHSPTCHSPTAVDLSDAEELQKMPMTVQCPDEHKFEIDSRRYIIDDGILPESRQRSGAESPIIRGAKNPGNLS